MSHGTGGAAHSPINSFKQILLQNQSNAGIQVWPYGNRTVRTLTISSGGDGLLPLLARLRLQGVGPASNLRQGRLDVSLVEGARQVRGVRPHQHGR